MKKIVLSLICLFIAGFQFAQEKKYPSLLWEIKKENSKPSYLYGTMHVSERIAFHLSDLFFEKLLSTDKIALESNPETWLDEIQNSPEEMGFGMDNYGYYQFYSSFQRSPIQNEILKQSFLFNDFMLNGILYRTNDFYNDYQEDTYLDMFIYQVGKRTNRSIVNLEGFKESRQLVEKAYLSNMRFDPPAWAKKMMKDKPFPVLLEDAYRDKNLDMIDSLNRGLNSPDYNRFMLYERNANMVRRMDSIFKKGETLFVGIGAAHLPGQGGVIEMLREKGYQVEPILGDYTEKGRKEKDRLDHAFQYDNYLLQTTSDGQLTLAAPTKLYEFEFPALSMASAPDLKNGAYVNIIRIKNYDFLRKNNYTTTLSKVDSLLYEYIPGDILKKEKIKINGFDAFDISNKTKEGDSQRYWIISTPLEYIIIGMVGKSEFVENQSKNMLKTLKMRETPDEWEKVSPVHGGYSVLVPGHYNIIANDPYGSLMSNSEVLGYDYSDNSYYFIIEKSINDISYLEETEFELKRIQHEFYKSLKIDSLNGKFTQNPPSYTSEAKLNDEKNIRLKTVVNGAHYYLLGTVGNAEKTKKFFDSFEIGEFTYFREPKIYRDTVLNYTVKTQIEPAGGQLDFEYYYRDNYNFNNNKNYFEGSNKTRTLTSESKQHIIVNHRKFSRYDYYENIDSLWNNILNNNIRDLKFQPVKKKIYTRPNGQYVMDVFFKNPESTQAIKTRYIASETGYHSIKALVDSGYSGNDAYIERFFDSFTPYDSVPGMSMFEKKIKLFLEDIQSPEDSIRSSALKSAYMLKFTHEDYSSLINLIENFDFKDEESTYKNILITKLGELNHPQVQSFLQNYYRKNSGDSNLQLAVLHAFLKKGDSESFKIVAKLMDEDLPLPSNLNSMNGIFEAFADNPENTSKIMGDLLKYRSIPEYQDYIITLAATLLEKGELPVRKIKPSRKDFLTLAKLELKRTTSSWMESKRAQSSYYYNPKSTDISLLKNYIALLQPFSHENEISSFFQKVESLDIPELLLFTLEQKLESNDNSQKLIQNISQNKNSHWKLYKILKKKKQLNKFPEEISKQDVALAVLLDKNRQINEKEDSIEFLTTKNAVYKNKSYEIYFFKVKSKNRYSGVDTNQIGYTAFELDKDGTFKITQNKEGHSDSDFATEEFFDAMEIVEAAAEAVVEVAHEDFGAYESDADIYSYYGIEYIDEEDLEETYKNEIDRVLFHNKKRVSFGNDYYGGYLGY